MTWSSCYACTANDYPIPDMFVLKDVIGSAEKEE
jgi:hypothetical protein